MGDLHLTLLKFNLYGCKPIPGQIVRMLEHHLHSLQAFITIFETLTSSSLYGRKFRFFFSILVLV